MPSGCVHKAPQSDSNVELRQGQGDLEVPVAPGGQACQLVRSHHRLPALPVGQRVRECRHRAGRQGLYCPLIRIPVPGR